MPPEATDPSTAFTRVARGGRGRWCEQITPRPDRDRQPLPDGGIKTNSLGCGNGLSCKRLGGEIGGRLGPEIASSFGQKFEAKSWLRLRWRIHRGEGCSNRAVGHRRRGGGGRAGAGPSKPRCRQVRFFFQAEDGI